MKRGKEGLRKARKKGRRKNMWGENMKRGKGQKRDEKGTYRYDRKEKRRKERLEKVEKREEKDSKRGRKSERSAGRKNVIIGRKGKRKHLVKINEKKWKNTEVLI